MKTTYKERKKEAMKQLIEGCKFHIDIPKKRPGGQSCGMPTYPTVLHHEELGIKISISCNRSNYKNKKLALDLFELAVMELMG